MVYLDDSLSGIQIVDDYNGTSIEEYQEKVIE